MVHKWSLSTLFAFACITSQVPTAGSLQPTDNADITGLRKLRASFDNVPKWHVVATWGELPLHGRLCALGTWQIAVWERVWIVYSACVFDVHQDASMTHQLESNKELDNCRVCTASGFIRTRARGVLSVYRGRCSTGSGVDLDDAQRNRFLK